MLHFCTYFDANYLVRFLPLHRSLVRHCREPFTVYALCFDDAAFRALGALGLQGVVPVALPQFEQGDAPLAAAKASRSRAEYFFTCSPSWLLYVLRTYPEIDLLTYLDADLFFFSSPRGVLDEMGCASIFMVPHRFPERMQHLAKYGKYNVGLLAFRRDPNGLACLEWWRERCLEWCHDRVEAERYADQKYLDQWPGRFQGVCVSRNPGANLAPHHVELRTITRRAGRVLADGHPVVYYHFEGYKQETAALIDSGLTFAGYKLPRHVVRWLHVPYVNDLLAGRRCLARHGLDVRQGRGNRRNDRDTPDKVISVQYAFRCYLQGRYIACFGGRAHYCDSAAARAAVRALDWLTGRAESTEAQQG